MNVEDMSRTQDGSDSGERWTLSDIMVGECWDSVAPLLPTLNNIALTNPKVNGK